MGAARKGFDPLSSLFDVPGTGFTEETSGSLTLELDLGEEAETGEISTELTEATESMEDDTVQSIDKKLLAKALAKAALSRLEEQAEPEEEKAGLEQRAARPVSALEAARLAAAAEATKRQEVRQRQANSLPRRVEKLLSRKLMGVKRLEVVNALVMDDRKVLKALWKAHRTRMADHGVLGMVVSATSVLRALDAVPQGQLVAAIAATESSEYLVWVDIGSGATIAAFPDARTWITRRQ